MKSEMQRINKTAVRGWTVIVAVLTAAYLVEVIKQSRSVLYFAVFLVFALAPLIASYVIMAKKPDSSAIQNLFIYGYTLFYIWVLMTGATILTYVYILPVISLIIMFHNRRNLQAFCCLVILANIAVVALKLLGVIEELSMVTMADYEIQIGSVILCSVLALIASEINAALNREKIDRMKENEQMQKDTVLDILEVSGTVNSNMHEMTQHSDVMEEVAETTNLAMRQIAEEVQETIMAISSQQELTEQAADVIADTSLAADEINNSMAGVGKRVGDGLNNMNQLEQSAKGTGESSSAALKEMQEMMLKTEEVKNIISIITDIAGQTNMLALNASIEAARAGDAGRGFAVVADEINQLATQTKRATEKIRHEVDGLKKEAEEAYRAVHSMTEAGQEQNETIYKTTEIFSRINSDILGVNDKVVEQNGRMDRLKMINRDIGVNMERVTGASERVTANVEETLSMSDEARGAAETLEKIVSALQLEVNKLEKFRKV